MQPLSDSLAAAEQFDGVELLKRQCEQAISNGHYDELNLLNSHLFDNRHERHLYYLFCSYYLPKQQAVQALIQSVVANPSFQRAYLRLGELVEASADDLALLSRCVLPLALVPKWMRFNFSSKAQVGWRHAPEEDGFRLPKLLGAFNTTFPFTGCGAISPLQGRSCCVEEAVIYFDGYHLHAFDQLGAPFDLHNSNKNMPVIWECTQRLLRESQSVLALDAPVHIVGGPGAGSFYHWMIDICPQLALSKQLFPEITVRTVCSNAGGLRFQNAAMKLIEPNATFVDIRGPTIIKAPLAVVSFFENELGRNVPQWTVDFWRKLYEGAKLRGLCARPAISRVFVVRSLESRRALLPPDAVEAVMNAYGFQPIVLETLSLYEQFDLFAQADIVVAGHGAGLTHCLFMRPGSILVEIFGDHMVPCFRFLAGRGGVNYVPVSMNSRFNNLELRTRSERDETRFNNTEIDEEKLKKAVAFAISVSKSNAGLTGRDIASDVLNKLVASSKDPELLIDLVNISRERFGWFTKQFSRAIEYPWIVTQCGNVGSLNVVDIGTGCSPLPLYFAREGANVITVDHGAPVNMRAINGATEWGFLSYDKISPAIQSLNADASSVKLSKIDIVYAVGAIEHMPAAIRRAVINRAAQWLKPGGRMFLTIDMIAGTNALWNRALGTEVEDPAIHGTIDDMLAEITASGFRVDTYSRPGFGAICCTRL